MASLITIHDCSKCKLHKEVLLDHDIDPADMKVYHQIQVRLDNSKQAIRDDTLEAILDTLSYEEQEEYFEKVFTDDDETTLLFVEWWDLIKKKYGFDDSTKVDFEGSKFFRCVNDFGVPSFSGEFIPKDGVDINIM